MNDEVFKQIETAYRLMAHASYRPGAQSDGFGNITGPLDMPKEITRYAERWWASETSCEFFVGCACFPYRVATILAVEAARQMCSGMDGGQYALRFLKMAADQLEQALTR